jgi:hypothetical protein
VFTLSGTPAGNISCLAGNLGAALLDLGFGGDERLLQALTEAGHGGDSRLAAAYHLILSKRNQAGRWAMEYSYQGKTHADVEEQRKPSKWVTLRALRVLKGGGIEV